MTYRTLKKCDVDLVGSARKLMVSSPPPSRFPTGRWASHTSWQFFELLSQLGEVHVQRTARTLCSPSAAWSSWDSLQQLGGRSRIIIDCPSISKWAIQSMKVTPTARKTSQDVKPFHTIERPLEHLVGLYPPWFSTTAPLLYRPRIPLRSSYIPLPGHFSPPVSFPGVLA